MAKNMFSVDFANKLWNFELNAISFDLRYILNLL